ncbi:MAG: FMN-binding negative transcriptional regulator [Methylibium sp.]|uniref:FMN-binding negative transcriptional regulator n=1 Tax=Methylibium sp. TaxID=2067992 RepID=UPI0017B8DF75|nr:FMN-binding negative transcriptional regulator [Methylibium sp.]MBA3598003.1 FMN-binding negative transcriptional regulator [Methylibium sp.]
MYAPAHHAVTDLAVLHALIRARPLGTWVTQGEGELIANHVPFLLDENRGEHGTLVAHVARANPMWRSFSKSVASVVIFQGAQTYITPSWYASKREHGKVVPTWNYAVVHAHGMPRAIEDRNWLLALVSRLTKTHEAARAQPWQVSDAPADFIDRQLQAIVGIEIPITRLVGKWKVSQNRPAADRLGVVAGLLERDEAESTEMAALVQRHVDAGANG